MPPGYFSSSISIARPLWAKRLLLCFHSFAHNRVHEGHGSLTDKRDLLVSAVPLNLIPTRGRQFERFVKWFLTVDPEWSTQVSQVWLWDEYPNRWGRDCGIDLVFQHKNGQTWAVRAKCYSPSYEITKPDVDKFLI